MKSLAEFFEVPEGVEFKIGDMPDIYIIDNGRLKYFHRELENWFEACGNINVYSNKEIKILPPKKIISEDEKAILRNLPSEYKWIARDSKKEQNTLFIYTNEPYREKSYINWHYNGECEELNLFEHLFKCVKWEDDEPTKIYNLLNEV